MFIPCPYRPSLCVPHCHHVSDLAPVAILFCVTIRDHPLSVADQLCVNNSYCIFYIHTCIFLFFPFVGLLILFYFLYILLYLFFLLFYQKVGLSAGGGGVMGHAV